MSVKIPGLMTLVNDKRSEGSSNQQAEAWPQLEQVLEVCLGSTSTSGIPAHSALERLMALRPLAHAVSSVY